MTRREGVLILGVVAAIASVVLTVWAGLNDRTGPARCPHGLVASGAHCCGDGQRFVGGHCVGRALHCAPTQLRTGSGCVMPPGRVSIPGGRPPLDPADWSGSSEPRAKSPLVGAFDIDRGEVTVARWGACVKAKTCDVLPGNSDLGEPVRSVTAAQADAFCRYAGGRLPTGAEWTLAAMGKEARRFAWGSTGLVCRRAAYGLVSGPCSDGATGPELVGSRPDGATPEGVEDLSGNVAEWTRDDQHVIARGGSYRSRSASDLKTYAAETTGPRPDVGFRCVYPSGK